jgi:hypothetical protein
LPVDFHVERARDGGTLSTRRVTARQQGEVLLEALASFSTDVVDDEHQVAMPDVPDPETLLPVEDRLRDYADELGGHWVRKQPFELRYVDPPPCLAVERTPPSPRMRMWWRATEPVPEDPVLHSCLLTYLSGTTMLEAAIAMRGHSGGHVLGACRPRAVVSPSGRPERLGVVGSNVAKRDRRPGTGHRDDVQPDRRIGVHRNTGTVLRRQAHDLSLTASTWSLGQS